MGETAHLLSSSAVGVHTSREVVLSHCWFVTRHRRGCCANSGLGRLGKSEYEEFDKPPPLHLRYRGCGQDFPRRARVDGDYIVNSKIENGTAYL